MFLCLIAFFHVSLRCLGLTGYRRARCPATGLHRVFLHHLLHFIFFIILYSLEPREHIAQKLLVASESGRSRKNRRRGGRAPSQDSRWIPPPLPSNIPLPLPQTAHHHHRTLSGNRSLYFLCCLLSFSSFVLFPSFNSLPSSCCFVHIFNFLGFS